MLHERLSRSILNQSARGQAPPIMTGRHINKHLTCTLASSAGGPDVLAQGLRSYTRLQRVQPGAEPLGDELEEDEQPFEEDELTAESYCNHSRHELDAVHVLRLRRGPENSRHVCTGRVPVAPSHRPV